MLKKALTAAIIAATLSAPLSFAASADDPSFKLTLNGESKTLTLEDVGIYYTELEQAGLKNFFSSLLAGLTGKNHRFFWNASTSEAMIREAFDNTKPVNARFNYEDGQLSILPEASGDHFAVEPLLNKISDDFPNLKTYEIDTSTPDLMTEAELIQVYAQAETLLNEDFRVSIEDAVHHFPIQSKDLVISNESSGVSLTLGEPFIEYVLDTLESQVNQDAQNLTVLEAPEGDKKVITDGHVLDGTAIIRDLTDTMIRAGLREGKTEVTGVAQETKGEIVDKTGSGFDELELIATGVSNFKGNNEGRKFNVRKGLNDHLNGGIIQPGEDYSFNRHIDAPVTYSKGWKGAYAIFGGTNLVEVPGGGVCQTSTTIYRAALDAGLEIKQQKAHSMYVDYYAQPSNRGEGLEGDGLDATVYPPSGLDFKFTNSTGNIILVEAYNEGDDAIVKFYGIPDGRSTEFVGPISGSSQTDESRAAVGYLNHKQLAWKQVIRYADGSTKENWMVSSYNSAVPQY